MYTASGLPSTTLSNTPLSCAKRPSVVRLRMKMGSHENGVTHEHGQPLIVYLTNGAINDTIK